MSQLTGLQITTNIATALGDFDDLIKHINQTLSKPFELNLNVSNMQNQLKQVTDNLSKLKDQMDSTTSNKSLIDSTETTNQGNKIKQTINQIKEQLLSLKDVANVKINSSDINQATGDMDSFIATVTRATGAIEKLKYESSGLIDSTSGVSTPIYSQTKIQSVTDNSNAVQSKQLATEENALIERENGLIKDTTTLMDKKYSLEQQIISANQKSNTPLEEELTLRKEAVELQLQQANINLSNSSEEAKLTVLQKELELKDSESIANAKLEGQESLVTAEVQRRIGLYQQEKDLQIQGMQQKYGSSIDTASLEQAILDYKELGTSGVSSLTELNAKEQEINMSIKEMGANAKITSDTLKEAGSSTNMFSGLLTSMGKMIPMMATFTIAMGAFNAIKSGIDSFVEMDNTLEKLSITMNTTSQGLIDITHSMQDTAIATGSDVSEVQKAVAIYANLGETAQTSLAKAKSSIMLSNVTGLDTTTIVDGIHGIINEYNEAGLDAEATSTHIANSLVSISKNMAMDFGILKCAV